MNPEEYSNFLALGDEEYLSHETHLDVHNLPIHQHQSMLMGATL